MTLGCVEIAVGNAILNAFTTLPSREGGILASLGRLFFSHFPYLSVISDHIGTHCAILTLQTHLVPCQPVALCHCSNERAYFDFNIQQSIAVLSRSFNHHPCNEPSLPPYTNLQALRILNSRKKCGGE